MYPVATYTVPPSGQDESLQIASDNDKVAAEEPAAEVGAEISIEEVSEMRANAEEA
jgi:hypothetical protein